MSIRWFTRNHGSGPPEHRKLSVDRSTFRDDPHPPGQIKLRGETLANKEAAEDRQKQQAGALQKQGWRSSTGPEQAPKQSRGPR